MLMARSPKLEWNSVCAPCNRLRERESMCVRAKLMVKDIEGQVRNRLCGLKKERVSVEFVVTFVDSQEER